MGYVVAVVADSILVVLGLAYDLAYLAGLVLLLAVEQAPVHSDLQPLCLETG